MKPTCDWERELSEMPLGFGGFSTQTMKKVKERIAVMERRKSRRQLAVALAVLASLTVLGVVFRDRWTGWLSPRPESDPAWLQAAEEMVTLRVDFYDGPSFYTQYGDAFVIRHPSVGFETVASDAGPNRVTTPEEYARWVRENRIDLLRMPISYIDDLSRAGLLLPLDSLVERDHFDLGALYEPVVRAIREAGAGTLYGLAPMFSAYALYYNKSLFERHGVPLPADGMTWDDVLRTAARFAGLAADGQPVYGLSFGEGWRPSTANRALEAGLHQGLQIAAYDQPGHSRPRWTPRPGAPGGSGWRTASGRDGFTTGRPRRSREAQAWMTCTATTCFSPAARRWRTATTHFATTLSRRNSRNCSRTNGASSPCRRMRPEEAQATA